MNKNFDKVSKFLSYILRHKPESIGLVLDTDGWVRIDELIEKANRSGEAINRVLFEELVATNDKKRFTISDDGTKIRAAQGHSTQQVRLNHVEKVPPAFLYHGTATRFTDSISDQGLIPKGRHHVHLSDNEATAVSVGQRYGKAVVLKIPALLMHKQGFKFYLADNGVWLTEKVPSSFLSFE